MALLKLPLLSFEAIGTSFHYLTFQRWLSKKVVRIKPIPTDIKSAAQLSHRAYYRSVLDLWESTPFSNADLNAFRTRRRWSRRKDTTISDFNKVYLKLETVGIPLVAVYNVVATKISPGNITFTFNSAPGYLFYLWYSYNFSRPSHVAGYFTEAPAGTYTLNIPTFLVGKNLFFTIAPVKDKYTKILLWSDNFNDGNYNGWTVKDGVWTAVPLFLKGTVDLGEIATTAIVTPAGKKEIKWKQMHGNTGAGNWGSWFHPYRLNRDNEIRCELLCNPAPNNRYRIVQIVGGLIADDYYCYKYDFKSLIGNWFWIRFHIDDPNYYFKIWRDIEAEPDAWDHTGTINANLKIAGKLGAESWAVGGNGCGYDDISVFDYILSPPVYPYFFIAGIYQVLT